MELAIAKQTVTGLREIKIGCFGESYKQLKAVREVATCDQWTLLYIDRRKFLKKETSCILTEVTPADYGFKKLNLPDFYQAVIASGLRMCPIDVGPALRVSYVDQPIGDHLIVGMRPIRDGGGGLNVYSLSSRENGLWLSMFRWHPSIEEILSVHTKWLFRKRQQPSF